MHVCVHTHVYTHTHSHYFGNLLRVKCKLYFQVTLLMIKMTLTGQFYLGWEEL